MRHQFSPRLVIAALLAVFAMFGLGMSLRRFGVPLWSSRKTAIVRMTTDQQRLAMLSAMHMTINAAPRVALRVVPASEAKLTLTERVIDVEINGVCRAYPVSELERGYAAHVVNDWLGGQPIAVTW